MLNKYIEGYPMKFTSLLFIALFFLISCSSGVKNDSAEQDRLQEQNKDINDSDTKPLETEGTSVQRTASEVKITMDDILFDFNKTSLRTKGLSVLNELVKIMKKYPNTRLTVVGHSDNIGPNWAKKKVAYGRAKNVAKYLMKKGINKSRLRYEGKADKDPLLRNTTKENRTKNRRVELKLQNMPKIKV